MDRIKLVYNFKTNNGGIGDYIKFYIFALEYCIQNNYELYHLINDIPIEKYIILKNKSFYKNWKDIPDKEYLKNITAKITNKKIYYIIEPSTFNYDFDYNKIKIKIEEIFDFSDEIKLNVNNLISPNVKNYICMHLRMGDKFLENNRKNVICVEDKRKYEEHKIFKEIENNLNENIIFFCDNNNYKLKLKEKYKNIIITNSDIGHTGIKNTTDKQYLDSITEFYIMTQSKKIIACSNSGFSIISSKFKNIELIKLY